MHTSVKFKGRAYFTRRSEPIKCYSRKDCEPSQAPRNPSAFKVRVNKKMYNGTKVLGVKTVKGCSRLTGEVRDSSVYVLHRIGQISQSCGRELSTGSATPHY